MALDKRAEVFRLIDENNNQPVPEERNMYWVGGKPYDRDKLHETFLSGTKEADERLISLRGIDSVVRPPEDSVETEQPDREDAHVA